MTDRWDRVVRSYLWFVHEKAAWESSVGRASSHRQSQQHICDYPGLCC